MQLIQGVVLNTIPTQPKQIVTPEKILRAYTEICSTTKTSMDSCQVILMDPRRQANSEKNELPCWSALMSDGIVYIAPARFKAKIYALAPIAHQLESRSEEAAKDRCEVEAEGCNAEQELITTP